ncbi:type II toxin-antitoxin system VapC family toxin [Streptomyces albus]|uniref:type II toxin-antitoxin system VapC family toxin n=1 Tax=Streptomyces albus TaxID=1888 RepID=UPI00068EC7FD|nr:PIN domain-containing protein [Streptomyces albus]
MLIVDTGPLVALLNRNDPDHQSCAELLESHNGELLVTPYVLTEACYLLAKYVSPDAEINLIEAAAAEDLIQVPTERHDLFRMAELM